MQMQTAAVYCRVSGEEQAHGWSLDGQYDECRAYCERQGYRVVRAYRETGSGNNPDRQRFQGMIHGALKGEFGVVIVWKRDRFGRDPVTNGFFMRLLGERGVRVESVDQGPREESAQEEFLGYILDAVSRLEARNIAARCHMGRLQMARSGYWPTRPPYGYRRQRDSKALEVHPGQARGIRQMYEDVAAGHSLHDVAQRTGWHHTTISARIRSPAYKGHTTYDGVPIPMPRIVTPAQWQAANDALDATCAHHVRQPARSHHLG